MILDLQLLWELARSWPHEKDRLYYQKNSSFELLYDSGCHEFCHRCKLESTLNTILQQRKFTGEQNDSTN